MRILVVGSGGREHALLHKLKTSKSNPDLFIYPGNAGHKDCAQIVSLKNNNKSSLTTWAKENKIDFVIIGPEKELVEGYADAFREIQIPCVGPNQTAAQLEGSKKFSKQFMVEYGLPTADFEIVNSVEKTLIAARRFSPPYILKADGLAAGKGVYICKTMSELEHASHEIFELKKFGTAGDSALLEANLPGYELSVIALTNGSEFQILPIAQDHKRLLDADLGPNTGGMGTVAPMRIDSELEKKITERILKPTVQGIKSRGFLYRGVIFIGVMVVDGDPYILEYNTRFGDPETQVILPLIENDFAQVMLDLANGTLQKLNFSRKAAACIVNAAAGYPDQPIKGDTISIPESTHEKYVLFCGVMNDSNQKLASNGGRVLNAIGIGNSHSEAIQNAYDINARISFKGRQYRSDIGKNLK